MDARFSIKTVSLRVFGNSKGVVVDKTLCNSWGLLEDNIFVGGEKYGISAIENFCEKKRRGLV